MAALEGMNLPQWVIEAAAQGLRRNRELEMRHHETPTPIPVPPLPRQPAIESTVTPTETIIRSSNYEGAAARRMEALEAQMSQQGAAMNSVLSNMQVLLAQQRQQLQRREPEMQQQGIGGAPIGGAYTYQLTPGGSAGAGPSTAPIGMAQQMPGVYSGIGLQAPAAPLAPIGPPPARTVRMAMAPGDDETEDRDSIMNPRTGVTRRGVKIMEEPGKLNLPKFDGHGFSN
jgi:hypothetical protein